MWQIMQLVIVESPTKARKLKGYLGSDYQVEASFGHVRDLPKKQLGINLEDKFTPEYVVSEGKNKVINLLKKLAKSADKIILATDPDREGEAIAWHLEQVIGKGKFVRATFHEITKPAVLAALAHTGEINLALVDAQQARRVVDRLVGYKISPVLWRKIRRGLSAGRVQSVALRLIVDREREIAAFKPDEYWELDVALSAKNNNFGKIFLPDGKLPKELPNDVLIARVFELQGQAYKPTAKKEVEPLINWLNQAAYQVIAIDKKERKTSSLPPFITSTLQQSAANRFGMTSKQTMRLAQNLYEQGLITYHRTDSYNLSANAIAAARKYLAAQFGSEFVPATPRYFVNRSKSAQEAHEAIRVTEVLKETIIDEPQMTPRHQKLYDLIRRRFLASQMSAAVYDQTLITVQALQGQNQALLRTTGSVLRFAGWRKLFPVGDDVLLPELAVEEKLYFVDQSANQKFTQPPPRYNDASLVKELEKRDIGRPSTYAPTISLIEDRGYVERQDKKFIPTQIGLTVCDFLVANFTQLMQYDFTAEMETDLDRIADGKKQWQNFVKVFYEPLANLIEKVQTEADRVKIPVEETGEICPECGQEHGGKIVIRTGKFGKFKSCSRFPECRYTKNLVETVADLKCPVCGQGDVVIKRSRWGRQFYGCSLYPQCDWAGPKPPEPGQKISAEEWQTMKAERAERSEKFKARFKKNKPKPAKKSRAKKKANQ